MEFPLSRSSSIRYWLTETIGADSTLAIFEEQVKAVKNESKIEANKLRNLVHDDKNN